MPLWPQAFGDREPQAGMAPVPGLVRGAAHAVCPQGLSRSGCCHPDDRASRLSAHNVRRTTLWTPFRASSHARRREAPAQNAHEAPTGVSALFTYVQISFQKIVPKKSGFFLHQSSGWTKLSRRAMDFSAGRSFSLDKIGKHCTKLSRNRALPDPI